MPPSLSKEERGCTLVNRIPQRCSKPQSHRPGPSFLFLINIVAIIVFSIIFLPCVLIFKEGRGSACDPAPSGACRLPFPYYQTVSSRRSASFMSYKYPPCVQLAPPARPGSLRYRLSSSHIQARATLRPIGPLSRWHVSLAASLPYPFISSFALLSIKFCLQYKQSMPKKCYSAYRIWGQVLFSMPHLA
jgi:hypothetical protein